MAFDPIDLLKSDHRAIHSLFSTLGPQPDSRLVHQLVRELSMHDALEMAYLYPIMSLFVPRDGRTVDEAVEQHERISALLADVNRRGEDDPDLPELLDALRARFAAHVTLVEGEILPALPSTAPDDAGGRVATPVEEP